MTVVTGWRPGVVLSSLDLTPAVIAAIKAALSPAQVMALTIWAEGRSSFVKGRGWVANDMSAMIDVLEVIQNRATDPRWAKLGHKGVCLQRWAFSCWEPAGGPANFDALMNRAQRLLAGESPSDKLLNCLAAAEGCLAGALVSSMPARACHYYADWSPAPKWALHPKARLVAHRYNHLFYSDVP